MPNILPIKPPNKPPPMDIPPWALMFIPNTILVALIANISATILMMVFLILLPTFLNTSDSDLISPVKYPKNPSENVVLISSTNVVIPLLKI